MDCEMPFKNGWETTSELRNLGCKTPIIGYTAYSGLNDIKKCLSLGMNTVLNKPSPPAQIIQTIFDYI